MEEVHYGWQASARSQVFLQTLRNMVVFVLRDMVVFVLKDMVVFVLRDMFVFNLVVFVLRDMVVFILRPGPFQDRVFPLCC